MQTQSLPKPSDKWIPYYFFAFFSALVLILVPMCIIAVRTNTGVVTENPYEKGLVYNRDLQNAERQNELKWQSSLSLVPSGNSITVEFSLMDSNGNPLRDASVTLWIVRPLQGDLDRKMDMKLQHNGHYAATLTLPARGLWEVRVSAISGGQNYQTTRRVTLQ